MPSKNYYDCFFTTTIIENGKIVEEELQSSAISLQWMCAPVTCYAKTAGWRFVNEKNGDGLVRVWVQPLVILA